jgi:ABC-2 type transport system permease protein
MRILALALKDIRQILRDWKAALFLVVMPVLFTLFFGFVFGGAEGEGDPRLPVAFVDGDDGALLSHTLHDLLARSDVLRPVPLAGEEAAAVDRLVRDGAYPAALVVPPDFSARVLAGEDAPVTVIVDDQSSAGHTLSTALQGQVERLMGAVQVAELSAEAFEAAAGFGGAAERRAYVAEAVERALAAWQRPPIDVAMTGSGAAPPQEDAPAPNPFAQSSPGMIVQFAIFGLITSAMVLVMERQAGALRRLLTTPISRAGVIAGHALAMFLVVLLQEGILIGLGQLAFGVDYAQAPLAIALVAVALALFATSLGLFIGATARGEEQVISRSLIAMFVLASLGGAWFPLDVAGRTFAAIGHLLPTAWAMDGFQNVVIRGLGLRSVLLPAAVLLGYAGLFFGLAVWRFRFEE